EREERLEKARQREKAQEARRVKRRRVEEGGERGPVDEEAEWLLDWEGEGEEAGGSDPLSGLSAETRDTLSRMGLGGPKKMADEEELEDEVKVAPTRPSRRNACSNSPRSSTPRGPIPS
ncbi:hypothetical protein IMZ48_34720, partial [Candidatus Bathyarchaeota archaeon]|nr:hypothetical protein [Candidatus Bathyarchaeota archaeon]